MSFLSAVFLLIPEICISEEMMPSNDTLIIYHNAAPRSKTKPKESTKDEEEQKRILQERRLLYTQYIYSRSVREKRKLFNSLYEMWAQRMGYEKDDYKKDKELIRGFRLILGSEEAIYRVLFKSFFQFERPTLGRYSHTASNSGK